MTMLALDFGASLGFAIGNFENGKLKVLSYGCKSLAVHRRLVALYAFLDGFHKYEIHNIFYEKIHPRLQRSGEALRRYYEFETMINFFSEQQNIPAIGINTSTIKKEFSGNGRAQKSDMENAFKNKFPDLKYIDHNSTDAVATLYSGFLRKYPQKSP